MIQSPSRSWNGFTLIELLAVVLVVSLLAALIIPAVHQAREASRRVVCSNNLHQLGIALNGYATSHGVLPPGNHNGGYSLFPPLLPFLDQQPLYHCINFSERPFSPTFDIGSNATVARASLSTLLCPSDGNRPPHHACTSYAGNMGFGFCTDAPYSVCNNGAFYILASPTISYQHFSDGLSNTLAMAEWLFNASPPGARDARRSVFRLFAPQNSAVLYETSVASCSGLRIAEALIGEGRGENWFHGTIAKTLYTHALPVGRHSCVNGSSTLLGIVTATSLHRGGANCLFADGHVALTEDSISPATWRALGTRAGNDLR